MEPKNKFFLFLGKNFLEKLIFYLRIFFQVHYGYTKNLSWTFFITVCEPCVSQGGIFGPIFRLWKVDLHMGKYGITQSSHLLSSPFHRENL